MKKHHTTLIGIALLGLAVGVAASVTTVAVAEKADTKVAKSQGATSVGLVKLPKSVGGVGVGLTKLPVANK